jgi:hypothetical protein
VSLASHSILKSPIMIQGMSYMHETIRISYKKSSLHALSVGQYTFINMNSKLRLFFNTTLAEYVRV